MTIEKAILLAAFALTVRPTAAGTAEWVVISELMRNPFGLETSIPGGKSHEYVEIVNIGTAALSLDSLFLSDGLDADSVIPWRAPSERYRGCISGVRVLLPGQCGVILDPDYDSALRIDPACGYEFAEGTVLFTIGDAHLGDYSNLSETDGVFLYKGTVSRVDRVVAWAADSEAQVPPDAGMRLVLTQPSAAIEGAPAVVRSMLFGSPRYELSTSGPSLGRVESMINGLLSDYRFGELTEQTVMCTVAMLRVGTLLQPAVTVVRSGETQEVSIVGQWRQSESGVWKGVFPLALTGDEYAIRASDSNGSAKWVIDISEVWVPRKSLKITEVFPRAGTGGPEWFEIWNSSASGVNIRGWTFGDSDDAVAFCEGAYVVGAESYVVVTKDSAALRSLFPTLKRCIQPSRWHTLNNYRDSLGIWDNYGILHEHIRYDRDWVSDWNCGSLERLSFGRDAVSGQDWAPACPPSPGQPNGTAYWRTVSAPVLKVGPLPFTPNGDGVDDLLCISVHLPGDMSLILRVIGMDGREVRRFDGPASREYLWDGRDSHGGAAPVGPFFVIAEATGADGRSVRLRAKGVLWR